MNPNADPLAPTQCTCKTPTRSLPCDKDIWEETVKYCLKNPPEDASPAHNKPVPGFLRLVTKRHSLVPRWIYRLFRGDADNEYGFSINLADVQRMHLRLLQGRLTWLTLEAVFNKDHSVDAGVLTELGPALKDYGRSISPGAVDLKSIGEASDVPPLTKYKPQVQAFRDLQYMGRFTSPSTDPFRVCSSRGADRDLLDRYISHHHRRYIHFYHWLKPTARAAGPWESDDGMIRPIGGTRGEAFRRANLTRAGGALLAAAFLVGPMWGLVLRQEVYLQLEVVTGCIVAFGAVMVLALETLEAVFAATLAYAAVLMVFVGVVMARLGDGQ